MGKGRELRYSGLTGASGPSSSRHPSSEPALGAPLDLVLQEQGWDDGWGIKGRAYLADDRKQAGLDGSGPP